MVRDTNTQKLYKKLHRPSIQILEFLLDNENST